MNKSFMYKILAVIAKFAKFLASLLGCRHHSYRKEVVKEDRITKVTRSVTEGGTKDDSESISVPKE